jgi:hypothetical protein
LMKRETSRPPTPFPPSNARTIASQAPTNAMERLLRVVESERRQRRQVLFPVYEDPTVSTEGIQFSPSVVRQSSEEVIASHENSKTQSVSS